MEKEYITVEHNRIVIVANIVSNKPLSLREEDLINMMHEKGWQGGLTATQKHVLCEKLNMTIQNLNNVLGRLRDKKVLTPEEYAFHNVLHGWATQKIRELILK